MKVVQISPTYFSNTSIMSGGERYVMELATSLAETVDTTLVSFAPDRHSFLHGKLKIELFPVRYFIRGSQLNPLSFQYLQSVLSADIVHVHQVNTLISDLACLTATVFRKKAFVTEHGGGADFFLNHKLPIFQWYTGAIAQSGFCVTTLPQTLQTKTSIIKGGINLDRFVWNPDQPRENKILFVGRILPVKGVNYLVDALRLLGRSDCRLCILGKAYHPQFYADLKKQAEGLPIEFIHDADDQRLLYEYQTALVTVLPSVCTNCYGEYTPIPELMGFTLLESQACGTPAICTDAGGMSEFVQHGQTGFVVAQNSGEAIAEALQQLLNRSPEERQQWQQGCREWIEQFSWSKVVERHLEVYQQAVSG
ncbi:MAG: glycosyltransferase family 4 protein [Leptolyngbyaceae cyanobacterium bins.59]|nr:glycosyltransferase family 4 protein [Leptolyngbyaceae cyanobacterium bins.59]